MPIRDGAMLLLLNPKAYVIIALMFSQFVDPNAQHRTATVIAIATVFTLNNFIAFTTWAAAGDRILGRFRSDDTSRRTNRTLALLLAGVSLWIALG